MTEQHPGPYDGARFDPYATAPGAPTWGPGSPSAGQPVTPPADAPADPPAAPPTEAPEFYRRPPVGQTIAPPDPPADAAGPTAPPMAPPPTPTPSSSSTAGNSGGDEDFDAWWAQYAQEQPTVRLFREDWPIPFDVPLWVSNQIETGGDIGLREIKTMVDALYGDRAADRMISNGAGMQSLGVVLAWSSLRAQGQMVTFADAIAQAEKLGVEAQEQQTKRNEVNERLSAAAAGYAPDSPEARAANAAIEAHRESGKAPSFGTGGR